MQEKKAENSFDRKSLLGIVQALSAATAFIVFMVEVPPMLLKSGFSFYETLLIVWGETIMSIAIMYLIAMWMEKSTEKGATLTRKDMLLYTVVQTLIVIKILILASTKWWLYG
jgi:hypothetical protein